MSPFRLGKRAARPDAVKLKFRTYLKRAILGRAPPEFGYDHFLPLDCGLLGNDRFGDCVFAGAAHEHELWDALAGFHVEFTVDQVLADYAAVTGFDPADPSTDQGTDLQAAASYRRKVGVLDAAGNRHRIGAYVGLEPGDVEDHKLAAWLFGAAGVGLTVGDRQIEQFLNGEPWDGPTGGNAGGHYVSLIGCRAGFLLVVTFGRVHRVTPQFFAANNDESLAFLAEEMLRDGLGPTGIALEGLQADLAALTFAGQPKGAAA